MTFSQISKRTEKQKNAVFFFLLVWLNLLLFCWWRVSVYVRVVLFLTWSASVCRVKTHMLDSQRTTWESPISLHFFIPERKEKTER